MIDAQRLLDFAEAIREEKNLQRLVSESTNDEERQEIARLLSGVKRTVASLQAAMIETYDVNYVECRDIGHVWQTVSQDVVEGTLLRTLICTRCDTERHDSFGRYGDLDGRRYQHKAEYRMPKGISTGSERPRLNKSFWRGVTFMQAARR